MKVTVVKNLNVRIGKPSVNAPCIQFLVPGTVLEVDGNLYKGDKFNGIDTWLKDAAGNYYWIGGIENTQNLFVKSNDEPTPSFNWFRELGIKKIWKDFETNGAGARVAVLDTGYDKFNSEIKERVSKSEIFLGTKSVTIQDNLGHGTFCASLISCQNQRYNIGIAPQCNLYIGKVSHSGEFPQFINLIDAIKWAVTEIKADIISISLGIHLNNKKVINKFQEDLNAVIEGHDVLVLASSGDSVSGQIISKEFYPASLLNCESIGTIKNNLIDNITVRSDQTISHTLGVNIDGYGLGSVIEKKSGTSMSTAIVSGILALGVSYIKKHNLPLSMRDLINKLIESGNLISDDPKKIIVNPYQFIKNLKS